MVISQVVGRGPGAATEIAPGLGTAPAPSLSPNAKSEDLQMHPVELRHPEHTELRHEIGKEARLSVFCRHP